MTEEQKQIVANAERLLDFEELEKIRNEKRRELEIEYAAKAYYRCVEEHLRKAFEAEGTERADLLHELDLFF